MGKEARPIEVTLTEHEAAELLEPAGEGGHQGLHEQIRAQLDHGNRTLRLGDDLLGKIIRYMTQYGSGGFQGRLRRAFQRPLVQLLTA
jgi:hypothetical protein